MRRNIGQRLQPESQDSIIKNIDIDDMKAVAYGKDIDEQVIQIIYDSLKPGGSEQVIIISVRYL